MWVAEDGWRTNAQLMSEAGRSAFAAARDRNLPALVEANGKLVATCEGCHKQFKPELPSEGIAHQRPHSESHKSN
jgi:cytochrome c556